MTDEGIVLVDTLNSRAAAWLKAELDKRCDVSARYVIYSHNYSDHIYGAEELDAPGVTFITHRLAAQNIQTTKTKTVAPDISFSDNAPCCVTTAYMIAVARSVLSLSPVWWTGLC